MTNKEPAGKASDQMPLPPPLPPPPPLIPTLHTTDDQQQQLSGELKEVLTTEELRKLSKYFVAGASARITAAVIMSPIDTVKTRLQFQGKFNSVRRYGSMKEAFVTIFREEGLWGFFKGLPPRLMYITPAAAVSFMFYEQFKMLLKSHKNRNNGRTTKSQSAQEAYILKHPAVPVIAGGLARLLGTACRTPFDILRQRLQVQGSIKNSAYKGLGTFGSLRLLIKTEGWRGLWTGYSIAVLRDVPFAAIYFLSYELLKEQQIFRFKAEKERLAIYNHLLAGAGAGAVAATCTSPFDVVKTRLQTQSTLPLEERNKYNGGIVATLRSIVKEEGAAGLTQGLKPRLLYLTPAASLTFASYEQYKRLLGIE